MAQVPAPQQEHLPSVQVSAPQSSAQEMVSELLKATAKALEMEMQKVSAYVTPEKQGRVLRAPSKIQPSIPSP